MPKHVQKSQQCCPVVNVGQCRHTCLSRIFSQGSFLGWFNDVSKKTVTQIDVKDFCWDSKSQLVSKKKISWGLWRWEVLARQVVRNQGIERSPGPFLQGLMSPQLPKLKVQELTSTHWGTKQPRWEWQRTCANWQSRSKRSVEGWEELSFGMFCFFFSSVIHKPHFVGSSLKGFPWSYTTFSVDMLHHASLLAIGHKVVNHQGSSRKEPVQSPKCNVSNLQRNCSFCLIGVSESCFLHQSWHKNQSKHKPEVRIGQHHLAEMF